MIYKFKLVSDEAPNFFREIEIDPDATFLDLRNIILDSVGYSRDDLSSFYICDEDWRKETEITLEDMGSTSDQDIYLMADTPLSELLDDKGQKLIFVYDYVNDRIFFMELRQIIAGRSVDKPECVGSSGKAPAQTMSIEAYGAQLDKAVKQSGEDLGIDFYGSTEFNADELPEGFEDFNT